MLTSRDLAAAEDFISTWAEVANLRKTTTLGQPKQLDQFKSCLGHYAEALKQTALQAATERTAAPDMNFLKVLRLLAKLAQR